MAQQSQLDDDEDAVEILSTAQEQDLLAEFFDSVRYDAMPEEEMPDVPDPDEEPDVGTKDLVRTPEGARVFDQPIGSVIRRDHRPDFHIDTADGLRVFFEHDPAGSAADHFDRDVSDADVAHMRTHIRERTRAYLDRVYPDTDHITVYRGGTPGAGDPVVNVSTHRATANRFAAERGVPLSTFEISKADVLYAADAFPNLSLEEGEIGVPPQALVRHRINPGNATQRQLLNAEKWMAARGITEEDLRANLTEVLDRGIAGGYEEDGKAWYQNAHDLAVSLAKEHDLPVEDVSGTMAALSPRTEWEYNKRITRAVVDAATTNELLRVEAGDIKHAEEMYHIDLSRYVDHEIKTADLTATELAALHPKILGLTDNLTKAAKIARGEGTPDEVLGGAKVRNFYNNIMDPADPEPVTVDTHQIRLMLGRIDLPDTEYDYIAKIPARYNFFARQIAAVARERGLLPNQVQAISWLQWRHENPLGKRRVANAANYELEDK